MTGDDSIRGERRSDLGERAAVDPAADERPTREYATARITVRWYAQRCIHSGNCVRGLPRVFNPRRRPWVDVHAADADAIERTVRRCPSGALQYARHDHDDRASAASLGDTRPAARRPGQDDGDD